MLGHSFSLLNCLIDHQQISKGQTTNSISVFITSERQLLIVVFALQVYF